LSCTIYFAHVFRCLGPIQFFNSIWVRSALFGTLQPRNLCHAITQSSSSTRKVEQIRLSVVNVFFCSQRKDVRCVCLCGRRMYFYVPAFQVMRERTQAYVVEGLSGPRFLVHTTLYTHTTHTHLTRLCGSCIIILGGGRTATIFRRGLRFSNESCRHPSHSPRSPIQTAQTLSLDVPSQLDVSLPRTTSQRTELDDMPVYNASGSKLPKLLRRIVWCRMAEDPRKCPRLPRASVRRIVWCRWSSRHSCIDPEARWS